MLGVVIGLVSAVSLLVFLQRDPIAAKKKKEEQKKVQQERLEQQKKAQEAYQKKANDPLEAERRQKKKAELKAKMLKGMSEEDKHLIGDYISEQKKTGKSEEQIIKQASTKALLFVCLLMIVFLVCLIGMFIILGGNEEQVLQSVDKLIQTGRSFILWNFPRFAETSNEL